MINEIWEGLRLLLFFSSPKRGFYGGKRGLRILATRRPTPGQGWPLLLLRTSRRPCRQAAGRKARRPAVPVRGYRPFGVVWPHGWGQTKKECGRHCNRPTGPRRLPAGLRPPVAWWSRRLVVCGRARRGPSPARPRLWSILGGAPQSPAARVGPAVRNGCVPWRRQAPVFSVAPGPQRGAGT